ncbi:MAG: NDP-sugar synthase [bacterium]
MKALILIGGEGTRLRPITLNTLKCMVPIANKPFIEYQIELLKKYKIKDIILSICHMPEKLKKVIGNGKKYGVKIKYANEKSPLGTGGAIKNCEKLLDDTTLVLNGDILTDINIDSLIKVHKTSKALVTMALHKVADPSSYGVVETSVKGRIIKFTEKPVGADIKSSWINAGIYVFDKQALKYIPAGRKVSIERETFPSIIAADKVIQAYKAAYYWLDIGRIDNFKKANFDLIKGKYNGIKVKAYGKKCTIGKAIINTNTILGNSVTIGNGVFIENSVIFDNTVIRDGCTIKNSVICNDCLINEHSSVMNMVLGDRTIVKKYSKQGV